MRLHKTCYGYSIDNKSNNGQLGLYQIEKLLHSKETINRLNRQTMKWEKIFANHVSDKEVNTQNPQGTPIPQ